jgi:PAS domain S-box-containing protein
MGEALYESIVEESNDGILVAQDGEIIYANERLRELTGYAESELVGEPKTKLVTDDDTALVERYHGARTEGGTAPDQYEVTLETSAGDRIPIEFSVSQIPHDGEPAVVAFCRDVTKAKKREQEIEDLKSEYESVFENVQDALFLLDVDADRTVRFQRFNEREAEFTGKSTEEVRGKTPQEVFGEDIGSELEANYRECIERKETFVYEEELELTDETTVWQTKLTPIIVDGEVDRIVGSGREVTTLKEREQVLEQMVREANGIIEATSKTGMGQVAVDIAEDVLDSPVAGVSLLSEDSQRLEIVAAADEDPAESKIPSTFNRGEDDAPSEVVWEAFESGEPVHIDDTDECGGLADETPARSALVHPLGDHGVIIISETDSGGFDETDRNVIGLMAQTLTASLDRREQKRQLERARKRLRVLFEKAPDSITVHDVDGNVLDGNEQLVENLGYTREELLSMNVTDFAVGLDPAEGREVWGGMDTGEVHKVEGTHERKDGSTFPVWVWVAKLEVDGEPRFLALARNISERKRREQRLETLNERLELAVEGAELGVWDWNVETDEVDFSDQWGKMLGYAPEKVDDHLDEWEKRVHPDDLPEVEATLEAHFAGETDYYDSEHRMKTADGDWKWIRDIGRVVERDADGDPVRAVGIHLDIDDRKERERTLRQFQQAVEETAHAVYITDTDGTIEYVNPAFEDVTGYSEAEALGQTPRLLKSGEYDDEFYEEFWETISSGDRWVDEMIDRRADGDDIVLNQTVSPITDGEGNPQKFVAIAQDITQRKEAEEALERTQEELRQIIDLVPDLIFVKNRAGEYLLANETTAEFYGTTPEEVEGSHESEVIPSVDDSEEFRQDDLEVIESGEPKFIPQEELTTAEGETRVLQTTKIPYEIAESEEDAVLGYARDVTDLTEYQRQLESQRDNLEVLNQVVRHDIRNDLQLVLAYTERLGSSVDGDNKEYIERVLDATQDAIDITTTARDVTRVMLQTDVDLKRIRLRPALESEVDDVRSNYGHALVRIDGTLPNIEVLADEMLESVFRNLLKNAIQHNDKEVPEVTVSGTRTDGTVAVRIADNGPGISDERKEEVFEQGKMGLDSEGTGLGLYLVETLVERYDGEVYVEDNDPTGAVFVVELPLASE